MELAVQISLSFRGDKVFFDFGLYHTTNYHIILDRQLLVLLPLFRSSVLHIVTFVITIFYFKSAEKL